MRQQDQAVLNANLLPNLQLQTTAEFIHIVGAWNLVIPLAMPADSSNPQPLTNPLDRPSDIPSVRKDLGGIDHIMIAPNRQDRNRLPR